MTANRNKRQRPRTESGYGSKLLVSCAPDTRGTNGAANVREYMAL